MGVFRNRGLEEIANNILLPCNYATHGCEVKLIITERRQHEESCEFRPYSCPFPENCCNWQGSLEDVAPHLKISDRVTLSNEDEDVNLTIGDINKPGPVFSCSMLSRFGHDFIA
ncbi:E3 ubiquitin-protein ligase SIAH1A-like, partial [Cryptotermes secundus]|uniref:E3 ubiquitin-protein ligase SIAH1A-like n=1 Tax=Cryptotermes secundus TaxID=105785 RepID=UPI000CD7BA56